jgi:hypothetical protein
MKQSAAEALIGEEYVFDPVAFAERVVVEFHRLTRSPGWRSHTPGHGSRDGACHVESCRVAGVFAPSGVLLTRSTGMVRMPAQELFDHLVSPEGYAVIDPMSDPRDHLAPPVERYTWKPGCRLEAASSRARLPFMREREFVVLNAIDPANRRFVSKSILHASIPGGSRYSPEASRKNGAIRALNTFGIEVESADPGHSRVRCVNYADLAGIIPAGPLNLINTRFFLQAFHRRMERLARQARAGRV